MNMIVVKLGLHKERHKKCQECILQDTFLIISDDKGLYFLKTCQNMDFFSK